MLSYKYFPYLKYFVIIKINNNLFKLIFIEFNMEYHNSIFLSFIFSFDLEERK